MYRSRRYRNMDEGMLDLWKEQVINELEAYRDWGRNDHSRRWGLPRRRRNVLDYQQASRRLQDDLRREIAALRAVEQRAGRVRDPQVRELLRDILDEAQARGMDMEELARAYPRSGAGFWPGNGINLINILVVLLAASLLLPGVRKNLRPVAKKVVAGAVGLSEQFNTLLTTVKEEMEDIFAEAQFGRLTGALNSPAGEQADKK
ncbi:hypothetical protein [Desulfotomaculum copahuensis]|uniref:Uncharacterized protein n=1 Tax=Desulfotomaculum copahuensis TaxID=1838280 RepID=A0A1B7LER1_9FIRM|nr:hypothetical protein [Desulfotomaculum copahuensis]OAT81771.1 hypothetical protein A6M21_10250 [Desulfotomaculum copahuensis]